MFEKAVSKIITNNIVEYLSAVLFFVLLVVVFLNVILRYLFNAPLFWSDELARFTFIWLSYFGAVISMKRNRHFGFDLFIDAFPERIRRFLILAKDLCALFLVFYIGIAGLEMNRVLSFQRSPTLGISIAYAYLALPVGCGLMALLQLALIIENFRAAFMHSRAGVTLEKD
jgi:TRAP-type C4-dicarboxylate transport system permease small subunit